MMLRVVVVRVLVHVHRRRHGGGDNQGMREQESNETPHTDQSTTAQNPDYSDLTRDSNGLHAAVCSWDPEQRPVQQRSWPTATASGARRTCSPDRRRGSDVPGTPPRARRRRSGW